MKHLMPLTLKFIMISVALTVILGLLTPLSFLNLIYLSLFITIATYLIGDLLILPKTSNQVTTIVDTASAFILMLIYSFFTKATIPIGTAFITALVIAMGEWLLHKYIARMVIPGD